MSFKSLAVAFINTNAKLSTLAADMRAHFEDPSDRAFVRSECMPIIAEHYNIKLVAKERGEGFTLPESHKSYKTAANMLSLMVNAIVGERSGHTTRKEVKVTRAMKAAAASFIETCGSKAAAIAAIKAL
jgi:hypothetical protein